MVHIVNYIRLNVVFISYKKYILVFQTCHVSELHEFGETVYRTGCLSKEVIYRSNIKCTLPLNKFISISIQKVVYVPLCSKPNFV